MKRDLKSKAEELMDKTLVELTEKSGMYVASFNEIHFDHKLGRFVFDVFVKGNTYLEKTFFLSKMFAKMVAPKYDVICFLVIKDPNFDKTKLFRRVKTIHKYMKESNIRWGWLYIFMLEMNPSLKKAIQLLQIDSMAVVCLDVSSGELVFTDSLLGRQGRKLIRKK